MDDDENRPLTSAEQLLADSRRFADLYRSVSYAGSARPDPADADPDDDIPGDERDDDE